MNKRGLPVKINIILILLILITGDLFPQTNSLKNKFSFGIVSELLRNWKYQNSFHFGKYDSLKLDVIQSYSNRGNYDRADERCFGGFNDQLSFYRTAVTNSINYSNALKVYERAKIVRPAYGQRSTYQAEEEAYADFSVNNFCFI